MKGGKLKLKVSSSVKQFQLKAQKAWGLEEWGGVDDPDQQLVFFGLFHDRDFEVFHNFEGEKHVFWCGGDIIRLLQDYERRRVVKISKNTYHYCENEVEANSLRQAGIEPQIIPSFLGDINNYPVSFKIPTDGKWKIWMNAHPRREQEYGVDYARQIVKLMPDVEFHIYGVEKEYEGKIRNDADDLPNIIYHGLVPEVQLDEEIKNYHAGFRANEHDGLSEVVVKAILLGQYVISRLEYNGVMFFSKLDDIVYAIQLLKLQTEPNQARNLWKLNNFPFIQR